MKAPVMKGEQRASQEGAADMIIPNDTVGGLAALIKFNEEPTLPSAARLVRDERPAPALVRKSSGHWAAFQEEQLEQLQKAERAAGRLTEMRKSGKFGHRLPEVNRRMLAGEELNIPEQDPEARRPRHISTEPGAPTRPHLEFNDVVHFRRDDLIHHGVVAGLNRSRSHACVDTKAGRYIVRADELGHGLHPDVPATRRSGALEPMRDDGGVGGSEFHWRLMAMSPAERARALVENWRAQQAEGEGR
jgi:hypothetical protein